MDAWKAAGNAGREFDDDLWNAFNEARQKFYAKRNEFYEKCMLNMMKNMQKNKL